MAQNACSPLARAGGVDRASQSAMRLAAPAAGPFAVAVEVARQCERVRYIHRRRQDLVGESRLDIDSDTLVHPKVHQPALRRLMLLHTRRAIRAPGRAWCVGDRCAHASAVREFEVVDPQPLVRRYRQPLGRLVASQQMLEAAGRCPARWGFRTLADPRESMHYRQIVRRHLHRRVRQEDLGFRGMDSRHPLQWYRGRLR